MAGRSGEDVLETFDSDDEVSLLAASKLVQQNSKQPTNPLSHLSTMMGQLT